MVEPNFQVRVTADEATGALTAAYIRVRRGQVEETREVVPGRAFADYDADGILLGIELLSPCEAQVLDRIADHEPPAILRFLRGAAPRELISA